MAFTLVGVGSSANDGTGDALRTAFQTLNKIPTAANAGQLQGFKNRVVNGDMLIWQRGTPFVSSGYAADRMYCGNITSASRSTDVPSTQFKYSLEFANSSSNFPYAGQKIEAASMRDLAGQNVTFQFWAKNVSGAATLYVDIRSANAEDDFSATTARATSVVSASPSSSWVQYSVTFSAISTAFANGMELRIVRNNAAAATTRVTGLQLEPGATVTKFEHRPSAVELAICQRFYQAKTVRSENGSRHIPLAPMRTAPSVTVGVGSAANITSDGFELSHSAAADCTVAASAEL